MNLKVIYFSILLIFFISCSTSTKEILVASTTSLYDFGLVDKGVSLFEKKYNMKLTVIAVGSGQAIAMGRLGKVDAIFSHLPDEEKKLIEEGIAISRTPFAFNYFVLVGPVDNPAMVEKGESMKDAFKKIFQKNALFLSRGDNSGTHNMELKIWKSAGLNPTREKWYIELGVGMGQALITASEKSAYTISDISTFLKMKDRLNLRIITEDKHLKNVYSLLILKGVDSKVASILRKFVQSEDFKKIILECGRVDGKETLFPLL